MQRRTNSKSRKGTDQPAQKCVLCSLIQRALFFSKFPPSSLFLSFSRRNLFPFKTVSYPPRLRINCRLFALPRVKQNASRGHQRSARKERRGARPSVADSLFSPRTSSARARVVVVGTRGAKSSAPFFETCARRRRARSNCRRRRRRRLASENLPSDFFLEKRDALAMVLFERRKRSNEKKGL